MRFAALAAILATVLLSIALAARSLADPAGNGIVHIASDHHVDGHWFRGEHNGRYGWWWVVGRDWFAVDRPAQLAPELYTPPHRTKGWWYLCPDNLAYYPFVTSCMADWMRVQPR